MKILIVALSRFTSPTGICRHAANLAASLSEQQQIEQVTLVSGVWQSYYRDLIGSEPRKLTLFPLDLKNSSLSRNRWFLFGLPVLAKSLDTDIVHLSFPVPVRGQQGVYKTVATLHDLYPYDCPEVFGYPNVYFNRLFLRNCLKNVDGIACVSRATHSRLKTLFPTEAGKSCLIPNIVRQETGGSAKPKDWPDAPFLLVVAQHRANKNLGLAIRGFSELRKRNVLPHSTKLVIVGSNGPSTASITAAIDDLELHDHVLSLSSVPDRELRWLYEQCLLFLVTSTVEGFCLPLVEALRCSARVVCSDIPVLKEVAGDSCEYFSLGNSALDSFVDATKRALASQKTVRPELDRFSSTDVGWAYIRFYQQLAAKTAASEPVMSHP
jgi:glycosyltransferase involved in cell wall biosynthesis